MLYTADGSVCVHLCKHVIYERYFQRRLNKLILIKTKFALRQTLTLVVVSLLCALICVTGEPRVRNHKLLSSVTVTCCTKSC